MLRTFSFCLITAFAAVPAAAPNPAVGRWNEAPKNKPTETYSSPVITSSTVGIGRVLGARDEAAGPAVEYVNNGHKSHKIPSSPIPSLPSSPFSPSPFTTYASSSSTTSPPLVVSICDTFVTLAPRNPAVGRVDAANPSPRTATSSATPITTTSVHPGFELLPALQEDQHSLVRRDPAFKIINAIPYGESVVSLGGGSPVTLAPDLVQNLNALASLPPIPVAPFPSLRKVISVAASPTNDLDDFLPEPTSTNGLDFEVGASDETLTLYPDANSTIDKLSMGQVLVEAMSELESQIAKPFTSELLTKPLTTTWLPTSKWTFFRPEWNCIITVEANALPGKHGLTQHITYGMLQNTLAGLWGALYSKGSYYGAKFLINDRKWGYVGSGSIAPWRNGTLPRS